ncbi:plasmolipin-like [Gigantopelta aegis]|uniref:plasmolipin-like n=1 Tax=Gigantopelta aegis TaxID=1735272 RepID=UPI001B88848C|nr:plasmolipin-like [Gigantopelta aegis]
MATVTYEETTTTSSAPAIRPDPEYVKTINGILKIAEMVVSIIVLICASVDSIYWYSRGGGWVQFVAASALITVIILFIFHFMHIINRLPGPWTFIEFIYYCVFCALWLIAAIVAAVRAPWFASIGAAAFFCFAALAIFAIDTFFMFRGWQSVQHPVTGGTTTAATATTTTTTYETRTQY